MEKYLKHYTKANCEDCGLAYQEFGLDTTLPDSQWLAIHPKGREGLLCANCIVKRASHLPGIIAARMVFEICPASNDSMQNALQEVHKETDACDVRQYKQ